MDRIHSLLLVLILLTGLAIVAMLATGVRAGPLDPPGAPVSTDGVREPGTPISAIPFTITQPGRYYLTRNLTDAPDDVANGVTIQADNVTLDLHGFTLTGGASSIDGVLVSGARKNITIEHGGIRHWYNGIDAHSGNYVHISDVTVLENGTALGDGSFGVFLGPDSILEDCMVSLGKSVGIRAIDSVVRNCYVQGNADDGLQIYGTNAVGQSMVVGNHLSYNGPGVDAVDLRLDGWNVVMENSLGFVDFGTGTHESWLSRNDGVLTSDPAVGDYFPCNTPDNADNNHFWGCP
jgi:hypothetical protein